MPVCQCPTGPSIANIPLSDCPETLGQIQKVVFQRLYSGDVKNTIANPVLRASWTPLLSANDGTKVVQSPYLAAPATEPGAARTYGGGNETPSGIPLVIGREPTTFTANILQQMQRTIKAMKSYSCENVGVYLVDEFGRIACIADNPETPTAYSPIPIQGFFVGDKSLGGYDAPDMNAVSWNFLPHWSDNLVIVTPTDFNALTDLVTP